MERLTELLSKGSTGSLIGLLGILIGSIVSYIFYRASKLGARPVYQVSSLKLIGDLENKLPDEIDIFFRGNKVSRLTKTNVIIWNSGKTTLYGKDIVENDPLRIQFNADAQVLRVGIINKTREVNKFTVEISTASNNEVLCNFDFLDSNDGVVVELLHTDKGRWPKILGTIRGVPKGILNWGKVLNPKFSLLPMRIMGVKMKSTKLPFIIMLTLGFISIVMSVFIDTAVSLDSFLSSKDTNGITLRVAFFIVGILYISIPCLYLWMIRRKYPKTLSISDE